MVFPLFIYKQLSEKGFSNVYDKLEQIPITSEKKTPVDMSRQAVSKHIKILAECELLEQKKFGREIFYHLNFAKMKEIDQWLEQFKGLWENRFNQLDQLLSDES